MLEMLVRQALLARGTMDLPEAEMALRDQGPHTDFRGEREGIAIVHDRLRLAGAAGTRVELREGVQRICFPRAFAPCLDVGELFRRRCVRISDAPGARYASASHTAARAWVTRFCGAICRASSSKRTASSSRPQNVAARPAAAVIAVCQMPICHCLHSSSAELSALVRSIELALLKRNRSFARVRAENQVRVISESGQREHAPEPLVHASRLAELALQRYAPREESPQVTELDTPVA
jgi:hypothetical protein